LVNLLKNFLFFKYISYTGGHTLSGAVLEPRALNELIPNWSNSDESEDVKLKKLLKCFNFCLEMSA